MAPDEGVKRSERATVPGGAINRDCFNENEQKMSSLSGPPISSRLRVKKKYTKRSRMGKRR